MGYGKMSNYPNGFNYGVSIRNMPVLNTYGGDVYWVDSGTGSDGNKGTFDQPFSTIDYAIGRCTASNGDIILVKAGHAETVSAAGGIDCDVEGISIIGLGNGDNRPRITFSAAGSDIDIDAENVTIQNVIFDATAEVTASIDVNAAFFTMKNCLFVGSAAAQVHKIPIITDANANDMYLEGVEVQLLVADDGTTAITTTSSEAVRLVGADRAVIKGCYFSGDFTTSAINGVSTASKDIRILDNQINNIATENIAGGIDLVAACTGYIDGNKVYVDYATSNAALIDASSCVLGLNWVSNEANEIPVLHGVLESGDVEFKVDTIASDLVVADALIDTIKSDLIVLDGIVDGEVVKTATIASDLVVMDALIDTVKSDLIVLDGIVDGEVIKTTTIASDLVVMDALIDTIKSDIIVLDPIIDTIASDLIVLDSIADTIKSDFISFKAEWDTFETLMSDFVVKYTSDNP